MKGGRQLARMRNVAEKVSKELAENENVVGVVLVGSVASGRIHGKSDIDLIVVCNAPQKQQPSYQLQEAEGFQLEIHYTSIEHFQHTFDDEQYRDKGSAWFPANFSLQMLREGMILHDPNGKLALWRDRALQWRWRFSEIQPLFVQAKSLLDASKDRLEKGDVFAALVTLRDAFTPFSSALMMRLNLPSYWRPKDQSLQIPKLRDKYPELVQLFYEVHGLRNITVAWLENSLGELAILTKRYSWEQGPQLHIKGAKGCLRKGNVISSVLSARRAAYCLGIEILNKRGDKTPRYMFHAPTQLKVIDQTREQETDFHQFYQKIHQIDLWDTDSISMTMANFAKLLNEQKNPLE